jgi:hypothetical protein
MPNDNIINIYYNKLDNNLEIKRMGFPQLFLSIIIHKIDNGLILSQKEYVKGILKVFNIINCNSISILIEPNSYREVILKKIVMALP